jgi:hypothetical protein
MSFRYFDLFLQDNYVTKLQFSHVSSEFFEVQ